MSLRPVSMAGETPNAHPATVSTEGEQTTRVKMLLAEQYRKRPELDVNWAAFSLPELETFLNILAAEEELHKQQVRGHAITKKSHVFIIFPKFASIVSRIGTGTLQSQADLAAETN